MGRLSFQYINEQLLMPRIRELLFDWLPGGEVKGKEYRCGSVVGGKGDSFGCNIETGKWSDFATNERGGDLISLYATIKGIGNKAAANLLVETLGGTHATASEKKPIKPEAPTQVKSKASREPFEIIKPPDGVEPPDFKHFKFGDPVEVYDYRDAEGNLLHFMARYEPEDMERKQFVPYSWGSNGKWNKKAYPAPRPLYGLSQLTGKPLLMVEGEKAWMAAFDYFEGDYDVLTWSGGSQAWKKSDLEPLLKAKKIIFWPDADEPGRRSMRDLCEYILARNKNCEAIYLNVDGETGLDVADLHSDGLDRAGVIKWMKERMERIEPSNLKKEAKNEQPPPKAKDKKPKPKKSDPPGSFNEVYIRCGLDCTENGKAIANQSNINLLLSNYEPFKNMVWYDEFHDCVMTNWRSEEVVAWEEKDTLELVRIIQNNLRMRDVKKHIVDDAINLQASYVKKNEAKDWIKSLEWDGVERIDSFLIDYCGAEDNEYVRAVTKNLFIAMAARVMSPGCKFDYLLILEGEQNIAKSMLLDVLGGKFYGVPSDDLSKKDFILCTRGKFLMELPELDVFEGKSNNVKKRVLSTREDLIRGHYDKRHKPWPRSFVWVGTTNKEDYLDDETGDRRYWPVKIKHVLIDDLSENRDQLFAESLARFKNGETYWEVPESAKDEQAARQHDDLWTEPVKKYIDNIMEIRDLSVVLEHVGVDLGKQTKSHANRMAKLLRKLGWHNKPQYIDGKTIRKWRPRCVTYATNGHGGTISDMVTKNENGKRLVKNHATGEMIEY